MRSAFKTRSLFQANDSQRLSLSFQTVHSTANQQFSVNFIPLDYRGAKHFLKFDYRNLLLPKPLKYWPWASLMAQVFTKSLNTCGRSFIFKPNLLNLPLRAKNNHSYNQTAWNCIAHLYPPCFAVPPRPDLLQGIPLFKNSKLNTLYFMSIGITWKSIQLKKILTAAWMARANWISWIWIFTGCYFDLLLGDWYIIGTQMPNLRTLYLIIWNYVKHPSKLSRIQDKLQRLPAKTLRASIYLVAGKGFEPMTFGLWARRATRLLHPATTGENIDQKGFWVKSKIGTDHGLPVNKSHFLGQTCSQDCPCDSSRFSKS